MWMVSPGRTIIAWGRITTGVLQLGACGGASMFDDIDIPSFGLCRVSQFGRF